METPKLYTWTANISIIFEKIMDNINNYQPPVRLYNTYYIYCLSFGVYCLVFTIILCQYSNSPIRQYLRLCDMANMMQSRSASLHHQEYLLGARGGQTCFDKDLLIIYFFFEIGSSHKNTYFYCQQRRAAVISN